MARKSEKQSASMGRLHRAANAVKRLFTRGRSAVETASRSESRKVETHAGSAAAESATSRNVRTTQRPTDIPMDVLERAYTPPLTSSKASFRSDGADHQRDQEYAYGVADERWSDEDRYTNKSGDPRIGTHGRSYEPAEARDGSRE